MIHNYRTLVWLNSDLAENSIGPLPNQTDDDIGILNSFLLLPGGVQALPRALIMMGSDVNDALNVAGGSQTAFMTNVIRESWRSGDYRNYSGNTAKTSMVSIPAPIASSPYTYGLGSPPFIDLDVFNVNNAAPPGQVAALYDPAGSGLAPFVAGVYAPDSPSHPSRTLINGWTLGLLGGGFGTTCPGCGKKGEDIFLPVGQRKYFFELLTNAFGFLGCQPLGPPVGICDNPGSGPGSAFINFLSLKTSNPMRAGEARLAFGLAKTEKVELRVYDVTGRLVKTVTNRVFAAGQEHIVIWDGSDDAGNKVRRGGYFYQIKTPTWTSQKKLAVLSN
jgi:hypothetical protein